MARPREQNSVSLFPFLAVLVCAMGALILLLLVTTRRIRMEAVERAEQAARIADEAAAPASAPDDSRAVVPPLAEQDTQPAGAAPAVAEQRTAPALIGPTVEAPRPPPRPFDPNPELRARVAALTAERDRVRDRLRALGSDLHAARNRSGRLEREVIRTRREQEHTHSERERVRRQTADLEDEQRRLQAQIHEVERRLTEARQQQAVSPSRFVVVPYDGVSGTNRRPILIEFADDRIRFIPENVVLRKEDFEGFTPGYNPLLAGARVLVDYWTERSRRSAGEEPLPYVLLIVRPSGVGHYPLRLLLERLEQPFGYELLEEDQELALPDADPVAAELCRIAVERMLQQRDALMQIVRGSGTPATGTGTGASAGDLTSSDSPGAGGSFTSPPGSGAGDAFSGGGAAADGRTAAVERRGPVFRGYQRPSYDLIEPDSGIVLPTQQRRPLLVHVPGGRRGGGPGATVGEAPGAFQTERGGADRQPGQPGLAASGISPGAGSDADVGRNGVATMPQGAGLSRPAAAVGLNTGRESAGGAAGGELTVGDNAPPAADTVAEWSPFRTAARDSGDASTSDYVSADVGSAGGAGDAGERSRIAARPPAGRSHRQGGGMVDPFEAALRDPAAGPAMEDLSHPATPGSPTFGAVTGQQTSSGSLSSASGSAAGGAASGSSGSQSGSGSGAPASLTPPDADELSVPSLTLPTVSLRNRAISVSQPHRRRWGVSDPRATIGYERELRIEVSSDRLIVGEHVVPAGEGETSEELTNRTVLAIEAAARDWGRPPDAFYWIPALRFTVSPGGNMHYERLRGRLREWGLQSSATYTLEAPRTAGRSTP